MFLAFFIKLVFQTILHLGKQHAITFWSSTESLLGKEFSLVEGWGVKAKKLDDIVVQQLGQNIG